MSEKASKLEKNYVAGKPVPMKLFAAWEVDRTPPNCIPRLCSLTITNLSLTPLLPSDMTSVTIAVKMQSSKRILRSHEIPLHNGAVTIGSTAGLVNNQAHTFASGAGPASASSTQSTGCLNNPIIANDHSASSLISTELDLHFSLQYPHFIKRDGNRLVILLQRRKKYKSRTILGYKTLAEGIIRMDGVLQKSVDMNVELFSTSKTNNCRAGTLIAVIRAERVSSIPVDNDNKNNNNLLLDRIVDYSDEDEEVEFSSGEYNDDGMDLPLGTYNDRQKNSSNKYRNNQADSDSEFEIKDKGLSRAKISRTISLQQRNLKQKIFALLKRFKVTEELGGGVSRDSTSLRGDRELDALFQELESLSVCENDESGPDMDTLSLGSTPKPSLRPFFSATHSLLSEQQEERKNDQSKKTGIDTGFNNLNTINNLISPPTVDQKGNESSGNEGMHTDVEGHTSDNQNANSPPREKEHLQLNTPYSINFEKRSRLFRASSNSTSNSKCKRQILSLGSDNQQISSKGVTETCLSPTNFEPRKQLLEQLCKVFTNTDDSFLPEAVTIVTPIEALTSTNANIVTRLNSSLMAKFRPAFFPQNTSEVKVILQSLMNKIQKYCNSNAKPPTTIKILLIGNDWLQGSVLRHYVELLGCRPPDWVSHFRFYDVPIGNSSLARYLCSFDPSYNAMFGPESWTQLCEKAASSASACENKSDIVDFLNRIQRYLHTAGPCTQIPIAEAMVNYKEEDSCQIFVPFICDVRISYSDISQISFDSEECHNQNTSQSIPILSSSSKDGAYILSNSPPHSGRISPPTISQSHPKDSTQESIELHIDYWTIPKILDIKDKSLYKNIDSKNSIKSSFRSLQVYRLTQNYQLNELNNGLTVCFATKEKKQKQIMRLGKKKEKDQEKEQNIDGVSRLICSSKQSQHIRVYIDGTEWTGVKFFQLSSQWQTHVKNFPVALLGFTPSE